MANIVITGANRGIGLALVKQYLDDGNRVFGLCRNPAMASDLAELVAEANGRLSLHQLDMADGASIDGIAENLGDTPVDVLLNVAGVIGGKLDSLLDSTFAEEDFEHWRQAFEVMVIGPFRLS